MSASIIPAPPPAIRLVAALAGFLPPSPFTLFADILTISQLFVLRKSELWSCEDYWSTRVAVSVAAFASQAASSRRRDLYALYDFAQLL